MNHELLDYVRRSDAAQSAGDARAALEWHRSVPMFRRNRHGWLLEQLSLIGEESLPEWAWARWITYQAIRCERGDAGAIGRTLLPILVEALHQDLLQDCFDRHGDPIRVVATVAGESWAYHQMAAHASDIVEAFLHEHAGGALAEHADLARRWVGAEMSGYQLLQSRPGARLLVREAGAEETIEVLDLGARAAATAGWVLGRLVPSGIGDLSMFDMTPFATDESLAREVAATGNWLHPLTKAHRAGAVSSRALLREDYELVTDVGGLDLIRFGTRPADLGRAMADLRGGRDEVTRASYRILAAAVAGDLAAEDQAYVAAASLSPHVQDDVRRKLVRSGHPEPWVTWAGRTPNPARGRLLELAESARASA